MKRILLWLIVFLFGANYVCSEEPAIPNKQIEEARRKIEEQRLRDKAHIVRTFKGEVVDEHGALLEDVSLEIKVRHRLDGTTSTQKKTGLWKL